MRKTLKHVLTEYGTIALVLYLVIFFGVFFGLWLTIELGFREQIDSFVASVGRMFGREPTSRAGGGVAAWLLAYGATKVMQPLRIGLTILLTPVVARGWERLRGQRPASPSG